MANLISGTSGNWTSASTWRQVSAGTNNTNDTWGLTASLTTSPQASSSFVLPASQAVDAVAVRIEARGFSSSPTNTMTVELYNVTAAAVAGTCTMNVSQIPNTGGSLNWYVFVFSGGAITPNGTDSYTVRCYLSGTSPSVQLAVDTGTNWARMIRRVDAPASAPAAGDRLLILGEQTGGTAFTTHTVTMDVNATTAYGTGSFNEWQAALIIGRRGVLTYSTAGNTQLRISGWIAIANGGSFLMGTVASPIPRAYTAILEIVPTGDSTQGIGSSVGSVNSIQGESPTAGNNTVWTLTTNDITAGATSVNVAADTGWKSGSVVALGPTSRTRTHTSLMTLSADAGASSLSFTGGTTNAHLGTAPRQAEVILLTRNVKLRSTVATWTTCLRCSGTWDVDWAEFRYFGGGARRIDITLNSNTDSATFDYCAFYDSETGLFDTNGTGSAINVTFAVRHCVAYNYVTSSGQFATDGSMGVQSTTMSWIIDDCVLILGSNGSGLAINSCDGKTLTNLRIAGTSGNGITFGNSTNGSGGGVNMTTGPFNIHACSGYGLIIYPGKKFTVGALTIWRCNQAGLSFGSLSSYPFGLTDVTFESITVFGNSSTNIETSYAPFVRVRMKSVVSDNDASFSTARGLFLGTNPPWCDLQVDTATFGGSLAHSAADVSLYTYNDGMVSCVLHRGTFTAPTPIEIQITASTGMRGAGISVGKFNNVDGDSRLYTSFGTLQAETVTAESSPSLKMTPSSASYKLESNGSRPLHGFVVAVAAGQTKTISVRVRKSSTYNGNQPRLVRKATPGSLVGDADVVMATASASVETWETLSGTTPAADTSGVFEFVVDCNGTVGSVYVDTWDA